MNATVFRANISALGDQFFRPVGNINIAEGRYSFPCAWTFDLCSQMLSCDTNEPIR